MVMLTVFRNLIRNLAVAAVCIAAGAAAGGCKHVSDDLPPAGVWIVFPFEHDWRTWGVTAPLQHREFILSERLPQGFNYSAASQTGYGGVLLVGDINGAPAAYDMSCPVERKPDIRVAYDEDRNDAFCAHCGSRYSVINNYGQPTAGPAAERDDYRVLRTYNIATGPNGEYRVIRP